MAKHKTETGGKNRSKLAAVDGRAEPPAVIPRVPDGLTEAQAAAWEDFWQEPLSAKVNMAMDGPALVRMFTLRSQVERWQALTDADPVVAGSQGQPVVNPLIKQWMALLGECRQLEDRFLCSVKARIAVGVKAAQGLKTLEDLAKPAPDAAEDGDTAAADSDSGGWSYQVNDGGGT